MALTEDARKELKEAIAIVREDRFEKYVRSRTASTPPKEEPPKDEPPKDDGPPPPPPKDEPPKDEPKPRKGGYWGDLLDDE